MEDNKRSKPQQGALEVYFRELAKVLTDSGLDVQTVLSKAVSRPWSQASVKDLLWRQIQVAMTGKQSTTEITKLEVNEIYEVLNRHLVENWGSDVHIPFPSEEEKHFKTYTSDN